jgi:penicillin-binding protein 1C
MKNWMKTIIAFPLKNRWLLWPIGCLILFVLLLQFTAWIGTESFPTFAEVQAQYRSSEVKILDRHGTVIQSVRIDSRRRSLDWVPLAQISPSLLSALLEAEDRNFYHHSGVEWPALIKGMTGWLFRQGGRGASTISMQLASLLVPSLQAAGGGHRTAWQKWEQIQTARHIECQWDKSQILEAYLNLVSFRGEHQGIASASAAFFGKKPHGLNFEESAILAAQLRSPNASPEIVSRRASLLLKGIGQGGDFESLRLMVFQALSHPRPILVEAGWAPHASRLVMKMAPSGILPVQEIKTTLEATLQRYALEALQRQLLSLALQHVKDGALLLLDNQTGEVLAYVGSGGTQSSSPWSDGVQARRQAGSSLKPFLYALALGKRLITPVSWLEDAPLEIAVPTGLYRPENYNRRFLGLVTARTALASSLNVPAVRVLQLVGGEAFTSLLLDLGFRDLSGADYYGPSLALGSVDVSLWDLTNAYRCLANAGLWSTARLVPADLQLRASQRIFSPETSFIIGDILSDRESRAVTFNLENPLATRFWTAVKTGTSKDMRDNWCVGFSRRYTLGVWVGNFSGESMWNVSGITGAAPVWTEIMNYLHQELASTPPSAPAGVVCRKVQHSLDGQARMEWFLKGSEQSDQQPLEQASVTKIQSPAGGSIIALDPDIPPNQQKMLFEAVPRSFQPQWRLDGEEVGCNQNPFSWNPVKGKHRLQLMDSAGRLLDSVEFEVRGNVVTLVGDGD